MPRSAADINADLVIARAARVRILSGGQSKGADGASKSEASLAEVRETIKELEAELSYASSTAGAGITFTPTIGSTQ
jgi:hypothetical protein